MTDYKSLQIFWNDEFESTANHTVGLAGVKRIYDNGWSPEPHCAVCLFEVLFDDGAKKIYNQAYIPEIKVTPL